MYRETVQLHFHGFQPTERSFAHLEDIALELHLEAPHSSVIKMTITKHEDKYHGTAHVQSAAGRFFADSVDDNLFVVGEQLLARVRRQLSKWKTRRLHERQSLRKNGLFEIEQDSVEAS